MRSLLCKTGVFWKDIVVRSEQPVEKARGRHVLQTASLYELRAAAFAARFQSGQNEIFPHHNQARNFIDHP